MEAVQDKAGEKYWTGVWDKATLNPPINIRSRSVYGYPHRAMHRIFSNVFEGMNTKGMKLLEIGCGNSSWLSYFSNEFGFDVSGIDYSENGCLQAEKILTRDGVPGTIYCANAFLPPADLTGEFDVVTSFGVAEHFEDTANTLKAFGSFLKKGGILVTSVPNFCGLNGWMHKVMNRPVYDIHVPIDLKKINQAVSNAGLKIISSKYYICISLNVNLTGIDRPVSWYPFKRLISRTGAFLNIIFWWLEERLGPFPQSRFFSRGILSFARK